MSPAPPRLARGAVLAMAACAVLGCGVGEVVLLGETKLDGSDAQVANVDARVPDARTADTGTLDASAIDAAIDAATAHDAAQPPDDAGLPVCRELLPATVPRCAGAPRTTLSSPRTKWVWPAPSDSTVLDVWTSAIPLVANLDDDNRDGRVDLCDVPDLVVVASDTVVGSYYVYVIDGQTGAAKHRSTISVMPYFNPALADLDRDGTVEIVVVDDVGQVMVLGPDASVLHAGDVIGWPIPNLRGCEAITLADLEGDGAGEILVGAEVFEANGVRRFSGTFPAVMPFPFPPTTPPCSVPFAADLDGDGRLEVIFGSEVLSADGVPLRSPELTSGLGLVVALAAQGDPQLVVSDASGVQVLDDSGLPPTILGGCESALGFADVAGDGLPELIDLSCTGGVWSRVDGDWTHPWQGVIELTAGVVAFDFRQRGHADVIGGYDNLIQVLDGETGFELVSYPAGYGGGFAYPFAADVDNDGSADLVTLDQDADGRTRVLIVEATGRDWAPTRRIWNQHAYTVAGVHEDGRLPTAADRRQGVPASIRANAVVERGSICQP